MAFRFGAYHLIFLFVAFAILKVSVVEGECFSSFSLCLVKNGKERFNPYWCKARCRRLHYSGGSCGFCPRSCWMRSRAWKCICYGTSSC